MTGKLTTHVLDIAQGKPAAGMRIELHRLENGQKTPLADQVTNREGRTDRSMLDGDLFLPGDYQLLFHVGDYFAANGSPDARKFLNVVPISFHVDDASAGYHVPLLVSPWAYSTYRGS
jgi:5-hydroxyisourate hydrolase